MELDIETLELALVAARLSSLAYRTPIQVEYLRLRANNKSQAEALQVIKSQAEWKTSDQLHLSAEELAKLETRNAAMGYGEILNQFSEPSQYFDGKHSLFLQSTMAYTFFRPRPRGQRNVIYVVFRGTEDSEDIWADLKADQVEIRPQARPGDPDPYKDIGKRRVKIHAGFRDQFLAVSTALTRNVEAAAREAAKPADSVQVPSGPARWTDMVQDQINDEASRPAEGGVEIVIAGHSLGAALATIAAFLSAIEHPSIPVTLFGFGSPRVGNDAFADVFARVMARNRVFRFANRNDPVPGVPIPPRYVHVSGHYLLDEVRGSFTCRPLADEQFNTPLRKACAGLAWAGNAVTSCRYTCGGVLPWKQHPVGHYLERMKALVEAQRANGTK